VAIPQSDYRPELGKHVLHPIAPPLKPWKADLFAV
jgi:hypothetical protein